MRLQVIQLRLEATEVISVVLASPTGDRLPAWAAGAHIAITLPSGRVRQYSLCGPRDDPYRYTIAVLRVADGRGGSREIHETLRIGDVVEVGAPQNVFALSSAPRYVFIAGGIGITPIAAMIDELRSTPDSPEFTLIYGGRSRAAMAFADRLAGIPGATLIPQDESGLPDIAGVFAGSRTEPMCTAAARPRCSPWSRTSAPGTRGSSCTSRSSPPGPHRRPIGRLTVPSTWNWHAAAGP